MSNQYEIILSKAKVAYANHKYDEAINLAKGITRFNSSEDEAYIIMGNSYLLKNEVKLARQSYEKAIVLEPENGDYYFLLGNTYFSEDDYTNAVECYAKAESLGCKDEIKQKMYYVLGTLNQIDGKNSDALMNYKKAGDLKGNNQQRSQILLNQVEIYVNENRYEEAELTARSLKMVSPHDFNNHHLLFQILLHLGKYEDARDVLKEAADIFKDNNNKIEIIFDKALLYVSLAEKTKNDDNYKKAILCLDILDNCNLSKSVKYEKDITKAEILIRLKNIDDAIEILNNIIDIEDKENIDYIERAQLTIMNCYLEKENYREVVKYARKIKESENIVYKHNGYYSEAFAVGKLSEYDKTLEESSIELYMIAIAYFRNATISNPSDLLAIVYRAKSYCDINETEKALELSSILPLEAQVIVESYIKKEVMAKRIKGIRKN